MGGCDDHGQVLETGFGLGVRFADDAFVFARGGGVF